MSDVNRILSAIEQGDPRASEELLPLVYDELRRLAQQRLAQEQPGQTLQATALVNEAYIRLVKTGDPGWNSRGHFFGAAAQAMRRILVERARQRKSKKHGNERHRIDLDAIDVAADEASDELLALDAALQRLAREDPTAAKLVELRYFAGLTMPDTAVALGLSLRAAEREWTHARAWLRKEVSKDLGHETPDS